MESDSDEEAGSGWALPPINSARVIGSTPSPPSSLSLSSAHSAVLCSSCSCAAYHYNHRKQRDGRRRGQLPERSSRHGGGEEGRVRRRRPGLRRPLRPLRPEDHRRDLRHLLPHLRGVRVGDDQREQERDDHVPGRGHRVGPGGDGDGVRGGPHLRRALQPGRDLRLRHLRPLPVAAAAGVRAGADARRHARRRHAAPHVRRRPRALPRHAALRLRRPVPRHRDHHHLLPHVRHLRRRHRQQSHRGAGRAGRGRNHPAQRAHRRARVRRVDEPGPERGPGAGERGVQVHLGVRGGPCGGGRGRGVGLQPDPLHQQAPPRDHQEHLLPQEHEQDELQRLMIQQSLLQLINRVLACKIRGHQSKLIDVAARPPSYMWRIMWGVFQ